jgi:hypothetical protein
LPALDREARRSSRAASIASSRSAMDAGRLVARLHRSRKAKAQPPSRPLELEPSTPPATSRRAGRLRSRPSPATTRPAGVDSSQPGHALRDRRSSYGHPQHRPVGALHPSAAEGTRCWSPHRDAGRSSSAATAILVCHHTTRTLEPGCAASTRTSRGPGQPVRAGGRRLPARADRRRPPVVGRRRRRHRHRLRRRDDIHRRHQRLAPRARHRRGATRPARRAGGGVDVGQRSRRAPEPAPRAPSRSARRWSWSEAIIAPRGT